MLKLLLVATRAEVPGFVEKREQVIVPAGIAPNAGKTEVRIAAGNKTLERLLLDRALEVPETHNSSARRANKR